MEKNILRAILKKGENFCCKRRSFTTLDLETDTSFRFCNLSAGLLANFKTNL